MVRLITFGLLCAAALVVAAHARDDRRCLVPAAIVVAVNWLLFAMPWIYNPLSPAHLLVIGGLPASHEDMWAVSDLASLIVVIAICRHTWWAPVLWTPYLVTLSMHVVAWANDLEYVDYRDVLDAALVVQLATLFVVGGGGAADRVFDYCRGLCDIRSGSSKLARLFRSAS